VATLGTATTPAHVGKLLKLADEMVFSFDGDAAGRKAAWRALEVSLPLARDDKPIRFLFLPDGDDPDTYIRKHGKDAFERLAKEAQLLSEFLLAELRSQSDVRSAEGRSRLLVAAKPHVQKITAASLRLQLVKEIARLGGVTQEEAERALELRTGKTFSRPAPAKREFRPPSTSEWKLLSRVASYPALAAEIDPGLLDEMLEESQLLVEISTYYKGNADVEKLSNAMMIEQFKDSPHAELLFQAQAYGLELKESEADSTQFVRHTVWKLEIAQKNREIRSLEERLRQGLLSKDEHRSYASMISEVKALELKLQAEARAVSELTKSSGVG
jgi:DNA primase